MTQRTSDLRSTINDALTTKAPSPLSRLGAAAAGAAAAVGSAASSAGSGSSAGSDAGEAGTGLPGSANGDSTSAQPARTGPSPIEKLTALTAERPELVIGMAFVGGLLLATILKRLAR